MSKVYGWLRCDDARRSVVRAGRSVTTRAGTMAGCIELKVDETGEFDVRLVPHPGSNDGRSKTLLTGNVGERLSLPLTFKMEE